MPYQDTLTHCKNCGNEFVYRVEEQRRQQERGEEPTPPELCPSCRTAVHAEPRPAPQGEPSPKPTVEQKIKTTVALGPGPHEGRVKWYDGEKGYGFIVHSGGAEIFFHRTGIAPGETPHFPDDTQVTFLIEQTEKGPQAVDVARMDGAGNGE